MTLDEIAATLPNGFHDAQIVRLTIDYVRRTAHFEMKVWVGHPGGAERYRNASVELENLHFWIIEAPDSASPHEPDGAVTVDIGSVSSLKSPPSIQLPHVPSTAFVNWLFVFDWNAYMYVAADNAKMSWEGPEYTLWP